MTPEQLVNLRLGTKIKSLVNGRIIEMWGPEIEYFQKVVSNDPAYAKMLAAQWDYAHVDFPHDLCRACL